MDFLVLAQRFRIRNYVPMKSLLTVAWVLYVAGSAFAQIRNGTVTGQISASDGLDVAGVRVSAMVAGTDSVSTVATLVAFDQTDGRGRYSLRDLPPGRYYILAGRLDAPAYYPGTPVAASASIVTVGPGATITGVDFTISGSAGGRFARAAEPPDLSAYRLIFDSAATATLRIELAEAFLADNRREFLESMFRDNVYLILFQSYRKEQNWLKALETVDRLEKLVPRTPPDRLKLFHTEAMSIADRELMNRSKLEEYAKKIIAIDPNNESAAGVLQRLAAPDR